MNKFENRNIQYTYPYLTEDKSCDVLVVGGGISGAITAYFLAIKGYHVVIAEKNIVGFGGTSHTNGIAIGRYEYITLSKQNINIDRLQKLYNIALEDIFKIFQDVENYIKKSHIETILKELPIVPINIGKYIEFSSKLSKKHFITKNPQSNKMGSNTARHIDNNPIFDMCVGNVYENCSVQLDTYNFTIYLLLMLSNMENVEIFENTEIKEIQTKEDITFNITQNGFNIKAKSTIIATGINILDMLDESNVTSLYKSYSIVCDIEPSINITNDLNNTVAKDIATGNIYSLKNGVLIATSTPEKFNSKVDEKEERYKIKKIYNQTLQAITSNNSIKVKSYFSSLEICTKDMLGIIDELPNKPNVYCNVGVGENSIIQNVIGARILQDIPNGYYDKSMSMFRIK